MDRNIELYHKEHKKQLEFISNNIKKTYVVCKNKHLKHNRPFSISRKYLMILYNDINSELKPFKELLLDFDKRLEVVEEEYQYTIITNILLPKFEKIKTNNLMFLDFVTLLGKRTAINESRNMFSQNSSSYEQIYNLNRLDLFVFEDSKLIVNMSGLNNISEAVTSVKKETNVVKGLTIDRSTIINISEQDNSYENKNLIDEDFNFIIKKEYKKDFLNSYYYWTEDFIDEDKTTQDDFENVFFKKLVDHNSEIHFTCTTKNASVLLSQLAEKIFKNLTYSNIERSRLFFTKNGKLLTRLNISNSTRIYSDKTKKKVSDIINMIKFP